MEKQLKSIKFPGLEDTYVIPEGIQIDSTLSVSDKAADAKAVGDALNSHISDPVKHITSAERTNWNAAKTHADSAHAPSNAEPNQNAFSNIAVGSTTIAADSKTDTLTLVAGSNVTLTPDASNDKITIAAKDTTYSAATTSANGLMTSDMVKKLNSISDGGSITIDLDGAGVGEANLVNADTLGGISADEYVKKSDLLYYLRELGVVV